MLILDSCLCFFAFDCEVRLELVVDLDFLFVSLCISRFMFLYLLSVLMV